MAFRNCFLQIINFRNGLLLMCLLERSYNPLKQPKHYLLGDLFQRRIGVFLYYSFIGRYAAFHLVHVFIEFIQTGGHTFHCTRLTKSYEITPCLTASASSRTMPAKSCPFLVNVEISNLSPTALRVTQMTTISPIWRCQSLGSFSS